MAESGGRRLLSLDIKLGAQLIPTIKSKNEVRQLYDDVHLSQREAIGNGTVLKGRQIVFLILDYYKCNANLEYVYTVEILSNLKCGSDEALHVSGVLGSPSLGE